MAFARRPLVVVLALGAVAACGWLAVEEARYKRLDELEARPFPLRQVDLEPPAVARGLEYYGKLRAEIYIGRDGAVDRVEVKESTLPAAIAQRMVAAFAASRWEPGRKWMHRVRSMTVVQIEIPPPGGVRSPMRPDS